MFYKYSKTTTFTSPEDVKLVLIHVMGNLLLQSRKLVLILYMLIGKRNVVVEQQLYIKKTLKAKKGEASTSKFLSFEYSYQFETLSKVENITPAFIPKTRSFIKNLP